MTDELYLPKSDVDYLEAVLKTNDWAGGSNQSQVDVDACKHFTVSNTKISEVTHPLVAAWYTVMKAVEPAAASALPANSQREADAEAYGNYAQHISQQLGGATKSVEEVMAMHKKQRRQLMKLDLKQRFSWDLEAGLTPAERLANLKMLVLRDQIAEEGTNNLTIKNFFKIKTTMEASKLYKMMDSMPKGAN